MLNIQISETIKQTIRSMQFGLIEASGVSVHPSNVDFDNELKKLELELKEKYQDIAPSDDPVVSAVRRMYRQVGWEPTKYRPSSEALVRRLLKGNGLYRINNLVDYGNLVSARYHIPMGLYDTGKITGQAIMDIGKDGESYQGISKPEIHATGKIILRDDKGVFGNPTADSARTCVQVTTQSVLAVFFAPSAIERDFLQKTIDELAAYYNLFSKKVETQIQTV
ncbi:MAG: hypothetical protein KDF60_16595 [Calditrichaeota bacterium]|nr:hypothetical protein [Calditrichota bacterium]